MHHTGEIRLKTVQWAAEAALKTAFVLKFGGEDINFRL